MSAVPFFINRMSLNQNDTLLSTAEKTDILFKKLLSKPATSVDKAFYEEPNIFSRAAVFSNVQLYAETIPPVAPTDLIHMTENDTDDQGNSIVNSLYGKTSSISSMVRRYINVRLSTIPGNNGTSFKGPIDPDQSTMNVLQDMIPVNYDRNGSYVARVYRSNGTEILNGVGEWVIDTDAGVITFFAKGDTQLGLVDNDHPPIVSFYRYVGAKGISGRDTRILETGNQNLGTNHSLVIFPNQVTDETISSYQNVYSFEIRTQDAMLIPTGTSEERPSQVESGLIRYNTDNDEVEYYSSSISSWLSFNTNESDDPLRVFNSTLNMGDFGLIGRNENQSSELYTGIVRTHIDKTYKFLDNFLFDDLYSSIISSQYSLSNIEANRGTFSQLVSNETLEITNISTTMIGSSLLDIEPNEGTIKINQNKGFLFDFLTNIQESSQSLIIEDNIVSVAEIQKFIQIQVNSQKYWLPVYHLDF